RVLLLTRDLAHRKISFDLLEDRREIFFRRADDAVRARPCVEDLGRRALAEVRVVDRRASDAPPHEDADGAVGGHTRAALLEEKRDHRLFALREIARRVVAALLERDDLEPGAREFAQGHAAPRSRPDDDGIDRLLDVARELATA